MSGAFMRFQGSLPAVALTQPQPLVMLVISTRYGIDIGNRETMHQLGSAGTVPKSCFSPSLNIFSAHASADTGADAMAKMAIVKMAFRMVMPLPLGGCALPGRAGAALRAPDYIRMCRAGQPDLLPHTLFFSKTTVKTEQAVQGEWDE